MPKGKIIKALSGFYYVKDGDKIIQCRGRGNFRNRNITPLVGDNVHYEAEKITDGRIMSIDERRNYLNRPPIANVDQAVLLFSISEPDFDDSLLDRFLVHVESYEIKPIICITKSDLMMEPISNKIQDLVETYQTIGYQVYITSSVEDEGIDWFREALEGCISVFAGQSGVGKSSLLNTLNKELNIDTNAISKSLGRGKHTTRHVELLPVGTGFVADTPGFSSLQFAKIEAQELSLYFPEMKERSSQCKFRGCTHLVEPGCAIQEAVNTGEISQSRYKHYKLFYGEINQRKRRY
ncbi:ribosome small subunit-dependent GTPase A [Terrilactibacillus sp. BCM23-1]|uniref:Small ribosomal subunit biogenesis GTPase RsgA n=1 Tax=Terrilactibacillus tamarindi TaxID=2599694 RepID=A0A6N8CT01_9BACI|nr:ribosome small subunit-dependent GTPase A [Terrilactibacillus tamarindi]MTT32317.1 ribosome small subunit-dependent GTPase A [Terrilactibacillus tamarindi]